MNIAPAAFAALCGNKALDFAHISHNRAGVCLLDYRSARNFDFKVGALFTVASAAFAALAVLSGVFPFVSEVGKRCKIVIDNKNNVAAFAAVAAVGSARGNIFFSVKRNGTCAAVACLDFYFSSINKHNFVLLI